MDYFKNRPKNKLLKCGNCPYSFLSASIRDPAKGTVTISCLKCDQKYKDEWPDGTLIERKFANETADCYVLTKEGVWFTSLLKEHDYEDYFIT